jgi:prepilin-type N-terminal cleavage/methylation domain-containing protein
MTTMRSDRQTIAGFTLVEMLITIVLISALGIVGSNMFYNNLQTSTTVNKTAANFDQARYAMDRVVRELREIKYDTTTKGYSISNMGASSITFVRASNGLTGESTVTIALANGNLTISSSVSGATDDRVLATNVRALGSNPLFSYQNYTINEGTGLGTVGSTTSASDLRWIIVQFSIGAVDSNSTKTLDQRIKVSLRN